MTAHAGVRRGVVEGWIADPRVEHPATGQLAITPVPGRQHDAAVDAAAHHDARTPAVQIGNAGQEAIAAVPVAVVAAVAADTAPAVDRLAAGNVVDGFQCRAGPAVEDREVLGPVEDAAVRARPLVLVAPVLVRIADDPPLAILRPIGGLAGQLRPPVAVQVVHHELRVVLAVANVHPQIDAPQVGAVQLVGIQDRRAGDTCVSVVAPTRYLVEDNLVFSVSVQVGNRRIAWAILIDRLNRDFQKAVLPHGGGIRPLQFFPIQYRTHEVLERFGLDGIAVGEIRSPGQWCRSQTDRRISPGDPVHVERNRFWIGGKQAPADKDLSAGRADRHHATCEILHLPLRRRCR